MKLYFMALPNLSNRSNLPVKRCYFPLWTEVFMMEVVS